MYCPLPYGEVERWLPNPRLELFTAPFAPRFVFAPLGGVNVCQPGREDVIDALARFAFPPAPTVAFGRSNELFARALLKLVAGRDVLVGRDATLAFAFPRAPKLFGEAFARDAVKKCCELDGAWL